MYMNRIFGKSAFVLYKINITLYVICMYKCANITYSSEYLSEYLTLNNYTRLFSHLLQRLVAYCEMLFHYSFYKRSSSDNST